MNTANNVTASEVDAMSAKRLNQFVLENGINDLPDYFIELKPTEKKQAVKSVLFGEGKMPKFTPAKGEVKPKATKKPKPKAKAKKASTLDEASGTLEEALEKAEGAGGAVQALGKAVAEVLPPQGSTVIGSVALPEITSMDITTEADAVKMARDLLGIGDYATYHLGGIFCKMADQKWFMGHGTFRECCDVEFGVQYRKAAYFMQIFRAINDKGIDWHDVISVGWTKLKEMLDVMTKENAKEWATLAKGMSTVALIEHIKAGQVASGKEVAIPNPTVNKTFKLHEDQKEVVDAALSDAKQKGSTEYDTVALELICQQYLADPNAQPAASSVMNADVVAKYFAGLAGTEVGLKLVMAILDTDFSDVNIELDIPESYGI